jgi:TonB family protein
MSFILGGVITQDHQRKVKDMKLKSISAIALAVVLLAVITPARGDSGKPPTPVGGWAVFQAKVVYPEMAQKAGMEGEVLIHLFVDENGQTTDMKVVKGSRETGFVDAACTALRETAFEPGQRHSTPVGMWIVVRVVFSIYG